MKPRFLKKALPQVIVALCFPTAVLADKNADQPKNVKLDLITVQGEKIGRNADEITPNVKVINQYEAEKPQNTGVYSVIRQVSNVTAGDGDFVPNVRGISSYADTGLILSAGAKPRVPVSVDGVAQTFLSTSAFSNQSLWDINSVEMAKGPQPTNTGRNAFSGALRLYTNDPSFEHEGAFRIGYQNQKRKHTAALMVNMPILEDQLAFRVTGQLIDGTPFINNKKDFGSDEYDRNKEKLEQVRAKLRYAPKAIEGLDIVLSHEVRNDDQPSVNISGKTVADRPDPNDPVVYQWSTAGDTLNINKQKTSALNAKYVISDKVNLIVRAADRDGEVLWPEVVFIGDMIFENNETDLESYIQFSDMGIIKKGVVGFVNNRTTDTLVTPSSNFMGLDGENENNAFYTELELGVMDFDDDSDLVVIAGGRKETDKSSRTVMAVGNTLTDTTIKANKFLPKAGLRYSADKNTNFGYTYTENYRPGGVQSDLGAVFFGITTFAVTEFKEENISNHEIYAKTKLLNNKLELSGSIFQYKYKDAQIVGTSEESSIYPLTGNVPNATGQGVEVDASYNFDNGFSITAALGHLKTEISDDLNLQVQDPFGGPTQNKVIKKGTSLPMSPDFTASLGVNYAKENLELNASIRHVGKQKYSLDTDSTPEVDSYEVIDIAAGYTVPLKSIDLEIDAFVTNITDKRYLTSRVNANDTFYGEYATMGTPRTFGISLTARY